MTGVEWMEEARLLRAEVERQRARAEAAEADFQNCAHELEISDAAADRAVARASRLEAALRQCLSFLPHGLPGSSYDNAKVAARAALRGEEEP
jgi:hypothetical protein